MNTRSLAPSKSFAGKRPSLSRVKEPLRYGFDILVPFLLPGLLLAAWQIAASFKLLPVQILPAPSLVLQTLIDLARDGELAANLTTSLIRISVGFAIGASIGLILGIALGVSSRLEQYLGPLITGFAQIPSLGWVPILMLIFGLDETLKFIIIAKASFVPIVLATSEGIRGIPTSYREVARVFRLKPHVLLTKLIVPASLPTIFSGLRLGLAHAWIALVIVEMLAATEGVGYMMVWGRTLFQIDIVIAGMIVVGIIGFAMDLALTKIEARLKQWAPTHV